VTRSLRVRSCRAAPLVGLYDRLFLLSQSTIPAFNALLLAPLLYWSRLVPRVLPTVGLIAARCCWRALRR
jgi:hypothetical protein